MPAQAQGVGRMEIPAVAPHSAQRSGMRDRKMSRRRQEADRNLPIVCGSEMPDPDAA